MTKIDGVGRDAEIIVNEQGGKQSKTPSRLDLVPAEAIIEVGKVLEEGLKKYSIIDNWRLIDSRSHLNHVLVHIFAYLAGDRQDEHLSHAACRALMALEMYINEQKNNSQKEKTEN